MIVYLCGGINGLTDSQCSDWREYAKLELNCQVLDPMRRDYRGVEKGKEREIVESDLEDIDNSYFLLINATRPSWGTAMEIVYAYIKGKKCAAFTGGTSVSPWLSYHCRVFTDIDDAILWINDQL